MQNNNNLHLQFPNVAFSWGSETHLTKNEIALYLELLFMDIKKIDEYEESIIVSVDMLLYSLGWNTTHSTRDNTKILEALGTLIIKKYIKIEELSATLMSITINKDIVNAEATSVAGWDNDRARNFKNFTKLPLSDYMKVRGDGNFAIVLAYAKLRKSNELHTQKLKKDETYSYDIAIKEWEHVLGFGRTVTKEIISEAVEQKIIFKTDNGWKYSEELGKHIRKTNSYSDREEIVIPDETTIPKTSNPKLGKITSDNNRNNCTDVAILSDANVFEQIFGSGNLEFDGMLAFKTTTCTYTKEKGQKKIANICKSEKGKYAMSKVLEEVERHLENEKEKERKALKQKEDEQRMRELNFTEDEAEMYYLNKMSVDDILEFR